MPFVPDEPKSGFVPDREAELAAGSGPRGYTYAGQVKKPGDEPGFIRQAVSDITSPTGVGAALGAGVGGKAAADEEGGAIPNWLKPVLGAGAGAAVGAIGERKDPATAALGGAVGEMGGAGVSKALSPIVGRLRFNMGKYIGKIGDKVQEYFKLPTPVKTEQQLYEALHYDPNKSVFDSAAGESARNAYQGARQKITSLIGEGAQVTGDAARQIRKILYEHVPRYQKEVDSAVARWGESESGLPAGPNIRRPADIEIEKGIYGNIPETYLSKPPVLEPLYPGAKMFKIKEGTNIPGSGTLGGRTKPEVVSGPKKPQFNATDIIMSEPIMADKAMEFAMDLGKEAARKGGKTGKDNAEFRQALSDALNQLSQGAGDVYQAMNKDYSRAMNVLRSFDSAKLFKTGPKGAQGGLNRAALIKASNDAERTLRKADAQDLDAIIRFGKPPGYTSKTIALGGSGHLPWPLNVARVHLPRHEFEVRPLLPEKDIAQKLLDAALRSAGAYTGAEVGK